MYIYSSIEKISRQYLSLPFPPQAPGKAVVSIGAVHGWAAKGGAAGQIRVRHRQARRGRRHRRVARKALSQAAAAARRGPFHVGGESTHAHLRGVLPSGSRHAWPGSSATALREGGPVALTSSASPLKAASATIHPSHPSASGRPTSLHDGTLCVHPSEHPEVACLPMMSPVHEETEPLLEEPVPGFTEAEVHCPGAPPGSSAKGKGRRRDRRLSGRYLRSGGSHGHTSPPLPTRRGHR